MVAVLVCLGVCGFAVIADRLGLFRADTSTAPAPATGQVRAASNESFATTPASGHRALTEDGVEVLRMIVQSVLIDADGERAIVALGPAAGAGDDGLLVRPPSSWGTLVVELRGEDHCERLLAWQRTRALVALRAVRSDGTVLFASSPDDAVWLPITAPQMMNLPTT